MFEMKTLAYIVSPTNDRTHPWALHCSSTAPFPAPSTSHPASRTRTDDRHTAIWKIDLWSLVFDSSSLVSYKWCYQIPFKTAPSVGLTRSSSMSWRLAEPASKTWFTMCQNRPRMNHRAILCMRVRIFYVWITFEQTRQNSIDICRMRQLTLCLAAVAGISAYNLVIQELTLTG